MANDREKQGESERPTPAMIEAMSQERIARDASLGVGTIIECGVKSGLVIRKTGVFMDPEKFREFIEAYPPGCGVEIDARLVRYSWMENDVWEWAKEWGMD